MFGYIKPQIPELKVKEHELYKATYCGLCRAMGKRTGCMSKMTLSYDFVFLVLLRKVAEKRAGEVKKPIHIPDAVYNHFELVSHEEYDLAVSFTRDTWHGRMRACRGVGASLKEDELERWDKEHRKLLSETAPEKFEILHYAAIAELKKR